MSSPPRRVVIDNTDNDIRYDGPWFVRDGKNFDSQGNFGKVYNNTLHGTNGIASFSYVFNGVEGGILGTTNMKNISGVLEPKWECFVDNVSVGSTKQFAYTENNWPLCQWSNLLEGPHTVTLNASSSGQTFWFDRLQYTPSANAKLKDPTWVIDRLDSAIAYDSTWTLLGDAANLTMETGATLKFDFTGSRITWIGMIPTELSHTPTTAIYTIDNQTPTRFTLPGLAESSRSSEFNYMFFKTTELRYGSHKLVVTHEGSRSLTPLVLNYLLLESNKAAVDASGSNAGDKAPIGAIVGGVLGGLAIILATIFAFFYLRKTSKGKQQPELPHLVQPFLSHSSGPNSGTSHSPQITISTLHGSGPYPLNNGAVASIGSRNQFTGITGNSSQSSWANSSSTAHYQPRMERKQQAMVVSSTPAPSPLLQPQRLQPQSGASSSRMVIHEDSGIRLPAAPQQDTVDYPPIYTPG